MDSMQVYRGMDIGTAKPTAAERGEVPHHLIDLAEPGRGMDARPVAGGGSRGHRRHRGPGPSPRAAGRGHRPVRPGPGRRAGPARPLPGGPGRARRRDRHRRPPPAPRGARPAGRFPDGAEQPPPGHAGPGGDLRQRAAFLQLRARGGELSRPPRGASPGSGCSRPAVARANRAPLGAMMARRPPGGGTSAGRSTAWAVADRPPGARLPGAASAHLEDGVALDGAAVPRPCGAPGPSPGASGCGGGGIPGSRWYGADRQSVRRASQILGDWSADMNAALQPPGELLVTSSSTTGSATTSWWCSTRCAGSARRSTPVWRGGSATATGASGPTA